MLISFNWLKEFIEIDESPQETAERLTMAGLEAESVTSLEQGFKNVVVGQVRRIDPLADSDHLTVCQVDAGKESLQIVCGAPNHKIGDKVVVALPGARLAGGLKIAPTRIRGVESCGMICSEKELGISDEGSGVLILPEDTPLSAPAAEVLGRNDTILEFDLTPNRPDALSHLGIARELGALTGRPLRLPQLDLEESGPEIDSMSSVEILDPDLCPRYTGRIITDVTIGPSPLWMQQRLRAIGLRPINNVVDVTNYVLMEFGHPLHAFDYDLLAEQRIVVRRALEREKIRTLDGVERDLDPSMLLICDGRKPVAVAGVMGGENTEVQESTRRVFLEAAFFQPACIRRTSKRLGLRSESSHRFERGADIDGLVHALDRAASLIQELGRGKVAKGRIDPYPRKRSSVDIPVRLSSVQSLLGVEISPEETRDILARLSLEMVKQEEDEMVFRVPSFRIDLTREIDLIEEVARVYGYRRIPSTLPQVPLSSGEMAPEQRWTYRVRQTLAGLGYHETIHFSFHHPRDLDLLGLGETDPLRKQIRIRNPLSEEQSVLRSTMIAGLLQTLQHNLKRFIQDVRIFEVGKVFEPRGSGLPLETNRLAGLVYGSDRPVGWDVQPRDTDLFDVKGDLQEVLGGLGLSDIRFSAQDPCCFLHPGKSAWIESGTRKLGFIGELHPAVLQRYEFAKPVQSFDLDLDLCFEMASDRVRFAAIPRYPSVERDIAVVLDEEVAALAVQERIRNAEPGLIREVRLFDLYRGKPIPSGMKSMAFSIRFQASDRTLTDQEINGVLERMVADLNREYGATLRE